MRFLIIASALLASAPAFALDADTLAAAEQARQDVIAGKTVAECQEPVANRDMIAVAQKYAAGMINRKQYEAEMIRLIRTSRYLWEPITQPARSATAAGAHKR